jgi:hypothetical protein
MTKPEKKISSQKRPKNCAKYRKKYVQDILTDTDLLKINI